MKKALLALAVIAVSYSPALAVDEYWKLNGSANGSAGGATPSGTWDTGTTANWTTDPTGNSGTVTWAAGSKAIFSADGDATGSYTVTIAGTQSLVGLTMEEGTVISTSGGTLDFGATVGAPIDVQTGTFSQVSGTTFTGTRGIVKTGAGTLMLRGTNTASNTAGAGTNPYLTINGGTVDFLTDAQLGAAPAANTTTGVLTINGGTLKYNNTASLSLSVNRNLAVGVNGATIEVTNSANTGLSLSGGASGTLALTGPATAVITKTGAGRFTLNTTQSGYLGKFKVTGGSLNSAGDGRFGPVPASSVADYFTLDGGALRDALTTGVTWDAKRGITLLAGGGTLMQPGGGTATDSLTYNGIIAGTLGGNLTITNSDPAGGGTTDGIVILGGANTYTGPSGTTTTVTAGMTLRLGAAGVLPDTTVVNLAGSAAILDMATNNFNETVKSVSGTAGTIAVGTGKLTLLTSGTDTYSSVFTATSGGQIIMNGTSTGSLNLGAGSSTGFQGEFVINSGTVGIGGANNFGNAGTAQLTLAGGALSNNSATGRTLNVPKANLTGNFTVDDSLFVGGGQIAINTPATIIGGDRTITVKGTANLGLGDLREDVAGRSLIKDGSGTLALTGTAVGTAFTGDVEVKAGKLQVSGTSIVGTGNNAVKLNGGTLNSSATRVIATAPITNPISVTADSAITTTSTAASVNMAFTSNSIAGTAGTTLTFRNDGADGAADLFKPRLSGAGFDYQGKIKVDNTGTTFGKTQLEFANTGATVQTFSGEISGNGSLYRTSGNVGSGNGGTTELKSDNTYTGGTLVDEGTLLVNNPGPNSGTGTGDVTVLAGGKLGGSGKIGGNVISSGTLTPGNSPGVLSIGGNLSLLAGNYKYEIDSTPVATADLVNVTGNLAITAGAVTLGAVDLGSSLIPLGTKFTLINYGGNWNSGTFIGLPNYSTTLVVGLNRFAIKYNDTTGGSNFGGGSVGLGSKFVTLTAVPEASTFFVIGLGGIFAFAAVRMGKRLGVNVLNV